MVTYLGVEQTTKKTLLSLKLMMQMKGLLYLLYYLLYFCRFDFFFTEYNTQKLPLSYEIKWIVQYNSMQFNL